MRPLIPIALLLLALPGCRDTSLPPPPLHTGVLGACRGSVVRDYTTQHPGAGSFDDVASITCKLDEKLDDTATLASTAATVCAHALNAYQPPLPRKASAVRADTTGQAACMQNQTQCGYALFLNQKDPASSVLELLGPAGCSVQADASRGVLFACCTEPAPPVQPPGTGGPPTTNVPK